MQDSPIKESIAKRLEEERYVIPKEKKKRRKGFNIQLILIVSIILGLFFSILRLLPYFK